MQWLKHAFAIDPPGPATPTAEQQAAVDVVCREVVRRQMVTPALMFLEMVRPLNFVGAQALHFFMPFISALSAAPRGASGVDLPRQLADFLEHRGSIDYIAARLEELESAGLHAGQVEADGPLAESVSRPDSTSIDVPPAADGRGA